MIAMAGIAVIATACGGNSNSASPASSASLTGPEKPDLVVAVVPAEAQAGLYIAQAKGLFTQAGLHVTIKPVVSALTVIPALLHGDVDIAGGQYPSYIATQAKGLAQMRILAAGFALGPRVNEIVAPATGSVHSLADLKGKTIAVNILNSEGADLIYSSLKAHGITPAQVRLVAMPFPAMLPALAAGKIAAAYETEPFVTEATKSYGDRELADMSSGPTTDMPLTGCR
jgi:NitT/TauT family transport system substrate-binding protein